MNAQGKHFQIMWPTRKGGRVPREYNLRLQPTLNVYFSWTLSLLLYSLFVITYSLELHIWDMPDTWYRQACLINRQAGECNWQAIKLTDMPVARWMNLGSVTRVGNGHRNIKHVWYFTDSSRQAGKLQPCKHWSLKTLKKYLPTGRLQRNNPLTTGPQ